ncbi:MAG: hypothetical protein JWQ89_2697, partial [Devosia sp.]|uniref:DUF2259 domain-containing protein n=1 Tax=Devosia sp. TaxID=1871048 RepID=UPI002627AC8F
MRQRVVPAALVRLAASIGVLALAALPALAGDAANFAPLGFSADGRYFGFEEFGVQDGSGFPYSNIFILDVEADQWVGESPFRIRDEEEAPGFAAVRERSAAAAAKAFEELGITEPAVTVALNGDGEPGHDGSSITFGAPGLGLDPPAESSTLTLSSFPSTRPEPCVENYGFDPPVGFALELKTASATTEIHRDDTIPS